MATSSLLIILKSILVRLHRPNFCILVTTKSIECIIVGYLVCMYFYPVSDLSLCAAVITLLVGSVMSFPLAFGIIAQDPRYTSLPFVSVHKVQVQGNSPGLT